MSDFLQKQLVGKIGANVTLEDFLTDARGDLRVKDNIVANSVYHVFVNRWIRNFGREQILVSLCFDL